MAFQPVPNTWQLNMKGGLINGAKWEANLFWELDDYSQPDDTAANALMLKIHDAYTDNNFDDQLHSGWSFDSLEVTGLDAETDAQVTVSSHPVVGTISSEALPNSVAGLVNWFTALRGRSYRGRTFHPGFCETTSVGGGPTSTAKTAFNAWAQQLITDFFTVDVSRLVVVSRFSGFDLKNFPDGTTRKVPKPRVAGIPTPIISGVVDTWWKTQRRRGHIG